MCRPRFSRPSRSRARAPTLAAAWPRKSSTGRRDTRLSSKVNGHSKDVTFDAQGQVVSVEEETPIADIPSAAREAIQHAAGGGRWSSSRRVTEGARRFYEAQVRKGIKKSEVKVDASGQPVK